jgi:hypothetical protein
MTETTTRKRNLPTQDSVINFLRQQSTPLISGAIAQRFNMYSRVMMFGYLKRLAVTGQIEKLLHKERICYRVAPSASGLVGVYARPLPAYHRSILVIRD